MDKKILTSKLQEMGIKVENGKVRRKDIKAFLGAVAATKFKLEVLQRSALYYDSFNPEEDLNNIKNVKRIKEKHGEDSITLDTIMCGGFFHRLGGLLYGDLETEILDAGGREVTGPPERIERLTEAFEKVDKKPENIVTRKGMEEHIKKYHLKIDLDSLFGWRSKDE